MRSLLYGLFLVCVSCASSGQSVSSGHFFGGKVVGPYRSQYNNQMQCALVEGFTKEKSCYCTLTNDKDKNKVFLNVDLYPQLCEQSNVKHQ